MRRIYALAAGAVVLAAATTLACATVWPKATNGPVAYVPGLYAEYALVEADGQDGNASRLALKRLERQGLLPAPPLAAAERENLRSLPSGRDVTADGAIAALAWGEDVYELHGESPHQMNGLYRMEKNGRTLFAHRMDFGAEGPLLDARLVGGTPAFTFISACSAEPGNQAACGTDVWHDGSFASERYGVSSPRYLFSHDGQVGLVASDDGADRIYFNGRFVTPPFEKIWTHNCCASHELLPIVYADGTLLFYAQRGGAGYLVTVPLR